MLGDHGRATSGGGRARARAHAPEPVQPCSGARRSRPADVLRTRACGQRTGQLPQLASALGGGSLARNFLQTPRCGVVFVCGRDVVGLRAAQQGTSAISEMRAIPRSILGARRRPRPYREHGGGAPAADQTVLADRIQIARIVCPLARAHRRAMPLTFAPVLSSKLVLLTSAANPAPACVPATRSSVGSLFKPASSLKLGAPACQKAQSSM
eukprot:CAMPEP_0179878812 /NCGR_PEP_ID=MMETSP0982-20121206/25683_1 /TAXON_ID=483367 /ORGANISM="non described non described, Strain CCMP 2436" /LENGTH=210 /DNA_ID=CAMNT_0021771823 /DNA_START=73 /DNA_END=705 /DNA_ORIENTATION=+